MSLSSNSKILNNPKIKVLLPDPVLPIIPIFSNCAVLKLIESITLGNPL
jgi:hypothetical protein